MEYTVELSSLTQELTFQTIQVRLYQMILTGFHEPIWESLTLKALGFFFSFLLWADDINFNVSAMEASDDKKEESLSFQRPSAEEENNKEREET